jgi:hypothetical protein
MKKMLMNFADQMLSREQMKGVKGGAWYCDCGGGNGPVKNPDPNNLDCAYVCSGASPYNTNFGMGGSAGSPGGLPTPYVPCTTSHQTYLGNTPLGPPRSGC